MSKARFLLTPSAVIVLTLGICSFANAQATRTWVSGVGDDANPCSRTAPCKTFAGAISKTAAAGEISALDPAGFGTVTITKSMTINGDGTLAGILSAGTNGVNVNDSSSGSPGSIIVYLKSLSINGAGTGINGINFTSGKQVYVENCSIVGVTQNAINVSLSLSGKHIFVKNTSIRNVGLAGISLSTTTGFVAGVFDRVSLEGLPTGISVGNNAFISVRDSSISLNTTGVNVVGSGGATASIENCLLNNDVTAINVGATNILNLSSSTLESNGTAVASTAPANNLRSTGNNRFLGNTNDGPALTVTLQK